MCQLKGKLDEAVWTGAAFLDQAFSKLPEGEGVEVNIVGQGLGHSEGLMNHLLALWAKERRLRKAH